MNDETFGQLVMFNHTDSYTYRGLFAKQPNDCGAPISAKAEQPNRLSSDTQHNTSPTDSRRNKIYGWSDEQAYKQTKHPIKFNTISVGVSELCSLGGFLIFVTSLSVSSYRRRAPSVNLSALAHIAVECAEMFDQ